MPRCVLGVWVFTPTSETISGIDCLAGAPSAELQGAFVGTLSSRHCVCDCVCVVCVCCVRVCV